MTPTHPPPQPKQTQPNPPTDDNNDEDDDTTLSRLISAYLNQTPLPPSTKPSHPRSAQFLSDTHRMTLLRTTVRKTLSTSPQSPNSTTLPPEITDAIIDILRATHLRIPYPFSASSLRRVWGTTAAEAKRVGAFGVCEGARRHVRGAKAEWDGGGWRCACGGGEEVVWEEEGRRWRCGGGGERCGCGLCGEGGEDEGGRVTGWLKGVAGGMYGL